MNEITKDLLEQVANLHDIPQGAFNIRENGKALARQNTNEIEIISKKDKDGIDIVVQPNTKNKSVHIPVIVSVGGFDDLVYNDFYIGDNSDILIVAGCGIHNTTDQKSSHNGIHTFHIGKNCKVKYIEKHLGIGNNNTDKILNPITNIEVGENSVFEMDTIQLGGVSYSKRDTSAELKNNATLLITEKILTTNKDVAQTNFNVNLSGYNSKVEVVSRSVAKNKSKQSFYSNLIGKNKCFGHVECDGVISENAQITSTPKIVAKNVDAELVHEAAIGKISEEQITKLMTLGLDKESAEQKIIEGFLK